MTTPPTTPADTPAGVVDRCVCFDRTFASLLEEFAPGTRPEQGRGEDRAATDREGAIELTLEIVRSAVGCGAGCGLCVPYLRIALRTGRTAIGLFER